MKAWRTCWDVEIIQAVVCQGKCMCMFACVCVCLYMHIYLCIHMCTCMCVYMCKHSYGGRRPTKASFFRCCQPWLFGDNESHWPVTCKVGWLASKSQGSHVSISPALGLQPCSVMLGPFYVGSGSWTQIILLRGKDFTNWIICSPRYHFWSIVST